MERKQKFTSSPEDLINRYLLLKNKVNKSQTFYMGKVVNNNDNQKLGRCQIVVYGVFDGIPNDDLPWAIPNFSVNGEFIVPPIGSIVNVEFENDDIYAPHYTTKVVHRDTLLGERNENYPNSLILFSTENGDFQKINTEKNEWLIRTASGVMISIDADGNLDINAENTSSGIINITGNAKIKLDAAAIEVPSGSVIPSGTGFLQAQKFDSLTGLPVAGKLGIRS